MPPGKIEPELDIIRVLQIWAHDDIVTLAPLQAGCEEVKPFRNIFRDGHLIRFGPDH